MIVYGHNHFLIKSYTLEDLGIFNQEGSSRIKLETRQRYFHLFWIPFIPIGKLWAIRKDGTDNLYEMPVELQNAILAKYGYPKTPWYSAALIFIAVAIGLLFWLGDMAKSISSKNDFNNSVEETRMFIKYPTTGDCYIFKRYPEPDKWGNSTTFILKVKSYDDTRTQFISMYPSLYKDADYKDESNYFERFDLAEAYNYNPTYIDKKALEKSINDDYHRSKTPVWLDPMEGYYVLEKIDRRKLEE